MDEIPNGPIEPPTIPSDPAPEPIVAPPVDAPLEKKVGQSADDSEWCFAFDEVDKKLTVVFTQSCEQKMAFNLTGPEVQALMGFLSVCQQAMAQKSKGESRDRIRAS